MPVLPHVHHFCNAAQCHADIHILRWSVLSRGLQRRRCPPVRGVRPPARSLSQPQPVLLPSAARSCAAWLGAGLAWAHNRLPMLNLLYASLTFL
jgi:hypothetical protein